MSEKIHQVALFQQDDDSSSYEYKESVEKIQTQLSKFGLTSNQCKVYIFLGKYGSKTAPEVCRSLKLPRTETYHLLTTLQNKGIVAATFEHPIKFSALSITKAIKSLVNAEKERIKTLEKQETELKKLWETIPTFHNEISEIKDDKFQMLQGENQIHGKLNDMIRNSNKGVLIIGGEKDFLKFYHANFLEPLDKSPIELKILTSSTERTMYVFDEIDRSKVKRLPSSLESSLCFVIKDDDEILFYVKNADRASDNLSAMWTDSDALIFSNKLLFNSLWTKSKAIPI